MKKAMFTSIILIFLFALASYAEVVYVSSMKTSLYKKADRGSSKVSVLKKGARLTVLSKQGSWLKVRFANKKGWISKMATNKKKPGKKISLLGSAGQNARVHARKRASSDVTAASARGLLDEETEGSGNNRSKSADAKSDAAAKEALSKMERLYVPEKELMKFLYDGKLQ